MENNSNIETGLHYNMIETNIQTTENNSIMIIDNFFSDKILEKIINYFNTKKWNCQCSKDQNVNLYNDSPYWRKELENEILFNSELSSIIKHYFNLYKKDSQILKKLLMDINHEQNKSDNFYQENNNKQIKLNRIYAVGQTYGQDSNFHIDDGRPNAITFCFYINLNEHINDDGLFYLKIPNEKYIITVEPTMNRAVIFPSNYRHKGCGLNRYSDHFRICIAWKFEIIK